MSIRNILLPKKKIPKLEKTFDKKIKDDFYAFDKDKPARLMQRQVLSILWLEWHNYDNFILRLPTGSGKSVIGKSVLNWCKDGWILTPRLGLQKQYLRDFADLANLQGRKNFKCLLDCKKIIRGYEGKCRANDAPCTLINNYDCPVKDKCPYLKQKRNALDADYSITNPYFAFLYPHIDERDVAIFDEGDATKDIMKECLSFTITKSDFIYMKEDYEKFYNPRTYIPIFESGEEKLLRELSSLTKKELSFNENIKKKKTFDKLKNLLPLIKSYSNEYRIDFSSIGSIIFKPLRLKHIDNRKRLGEKQIYMSATFPIINVDIEELKLKRDDTLAITLGYHPWKLSNRKIICDKVGYMSRNSKEKTMPKLFAKIESLVDLHENDKCVIVPNSHSLRYEIFEFLRNDYKERVITHGRNSYERDYNIQRFIDSDEPKILVSTYVGLGADFKDDLCRCLIIPKIPYPSIDEYTRDLMKLEQEEYVKEKGCRIYERESRNIYGNNLCSSFKCKRQCTKSYNNQVLRNLIQMCGRSVRHKDDWCDIHILDTSINGILRRFKRHIPNYFLNSLVKDDGEQMVSRQR